jgi:hypothetical protein
VAELISTAWRLVPRGRNRVPLSAYPSVAGKLISSTKTSSNAASMGRRYPASFLAVPSKCEFGFSRKGLQCQMDLQLAAKD